MTLAVLSPYNQQVALINKRLEESEITSAGLSLKDTIKRKDHIGAVDTPARVAYSVDSFQGNQADIIAVSLVRNNNLPVGDGLGFLVEAARMNVLLSRAERLLILVGSWEFFERQISAVPVDDHHLPLWHWKRVMTSLKDGIESGRVLRISATDLLESTPS